MFKIALPHAIAVLIFLIISVAYCLPVFQGMVVSQQDMLGTRGMTQQSFEFFEKYGRYPLWTNSMFGGMPTFQIIFGGMFDTGVNYLHLLQTLMDCPSSFMRNKMIENHQL